MLTILMLTISNVFMTIAWYGHLKFKYSPLWAAILVSWWNAEDESEWRWQVEFYNHRRGGGRKA